MGQGSVFLPVRPCWASASQDDDLSLGEQHALFFEGGAIAGLHAGTDGEETEVEPEGSVGDDGESAPQPAHGAGDRPVTDFAEAISAWADGILATARALLVR